MNITPVYIAEEKEEAPPPQIKRLAADWQKVRDELTGLFYWKPKEDEKDKNGSD